MNNFNSLKENKCCSKFDINKVKIIIQEIEKNIKEKVGTIVSLINEDNKNFAEKFTYSKFLNSIEKVKKEPWLLETKSKNLLIDGLGNLAVIYNGNPELLLYLSLKALKTHNNIVFFEDSNIHKTSEYIINIINNILEKNNYNVVITTKTVKKFKEIYEYQNYFNTFICIGEIYKFNDLKDNIKKDIIYSAYGTLSLYLDDKNLKDTLLQMDDYIFENNLFIDLYKDENIEDVIKKINEKGENFCAVIFTKDIQKAYYFLENVNSQTIYVNKNPFKDYIFTLDDKNIIKIKKVII